MNEGCPLENQASTMEQDFSADVDHKLVGTQEMKPCGSECNDQILQLREQLSFKEEELAQKNQIIKQLQQRCMLVSIYQQKIQTLQSKACQLEKILDRLEKSKTAIEAPPKTQNSHPIILECDEFVLREHTPSNHPTDPSSSKKLPSCQYIAKQIKQEAKNSNKENRKSSLKVKENLLLNQQTKQRNPEDRRKEKTQVLLGEDKASSKFLIADKDQKHKDIDSKFSKIKENIQTQNKPKSTKNIEEIYTILNNHKLRREELAIKGINQKLQTILNESVRLSNNPSPAKKSPTDRFSTHSNTQWQAEKQQFFNNLASSRHRGESFNLNSSFSGSSKDKSGVHGSRTERSYTNNDSIFYRPVAGGGKTVLKNMDNKKFTKILNATTVDEILRARRCPSGSGLTVGGLNRSHVVLERPQKSRMYWN